MSTLLSSRQTEADDAWANFKMWHYTPSIPAAIVFTILFTILTSYHTYLLTRRRTWFCIPFVIGGIFEVIGCIARAVAHNALQSVPLYAMQNLLLLLAPILFAASVYMILGRIIRGVRGEEYSVIRVAWLTKIFVGSDVFCFMIQGGGGGMLATAKTKEKIDLCNNIVLGGLVLQIVVFCFFVVAAVIFQTRMTRRPTAAATEGPLGSGSYVGAVGRWTPGSNMPGWKRLMVGLYLTSAFITLRNLFRVVEYGLGWNNYLLNHEWVLYVFDGLMMVCVLVVCVMWYAPDLAKGSLVADEGTLRMEEGDGERRLKEGARVEEGQGVRTWS